MEEFTKGYTASKTATLLAETDKIITDIRHSQEELVPARFAKLRKTIRMTKKSANSLLLTAHVSLHDKIAYEQQRRALARQKAILAEWGTQQTLWVSMLKKVKEQKKQLKRLQKVQEEYGLVCGSSDCNEEYKAGLEEKIIHAVERSVRAQKAHGGTMEQLKMDISRMQDDSEWHQKQVELDEKAMERAKERAKEAKKKARVKRSEKIMCEEKEEKAKGDEWLPEQYKTKARKEN